MQDSKPMLASNVEDFSKLRFPAYVSAKLDGIRASMQNGRLVSRSLKPIPNKFVQAAFAGLPEGADGELIVGEPNDDPYRRTVSVVMSDDKPLDFYGDTVRFYQFDIMDDDRLFDVRYFNMTTGQRNLNHYIVPQIVIQNLHDLEVAETEFLKDGYEGLMFRDPNGRYKHGRSSEKEGILLKVKRFKDAEARVIGCEPEMENQNAAFTNELGRTARSSAKAGKVAKDTLGKLNCRGVGGDYDGVEFDVAVSSMTHEERKDIWDHFKMGLIVNKLVVYKYFPTGGDSRPRHPIFKGWRDKRDL